MGAGIAAADWAEASALLDHALDLAPDEHPAWLRDQERRHPRLAPLLKRLLAAHARAARGAALDQLPSWTAPAPEPSVREGERVGPYRLKRLLGRGGMAEVWLASRDDGAFERDVALKLPQQDVSRRDLAHRFERERDILARLEHPHIARLYDAGISIEGQPFLAMEFVDGRPITDDCDARRLGVHARLQLFLQVLDAVQVAHANLVIHRDLKPSNILVAPVGGARLLDFGIAKLLGASDEFHPGETLTRLGGRLLTPDYASPEQVKGDALTTATDVYSLGVVLYELLAGRRPYQLKLASLAQLEHAIVSTDAPRPSSVVTDEAARLRDEHCASRLARTLAGDLDTIVLKALSKTPEQRYATVVEFRDDLQRHLDGLPVLARPASWTYRARKFISRNRLPVAAACGAACVLLAATGVALRQADIAREQAQRAQAQAERADQVKRFVLSFFEGADVGQSGRRETTAAELLKQAQQRLEASPIGDAGIRAELLTTIGTGLLGLGERALAEPLLADASRLAAERVGVADPVAAEAATAYGRALMERGDLPGAAAQFAVAQQRSRAGGHLVPLSAALRAEADLRNTEGQTDRAIELTRAAIAAAEAQSGPADRRALIEAWLQLSTLMRNSSRGGALEPAQRAWDLARELYSERPTPLLLEAHLTYASVLAEEKSLSGALAEMRTIAEQQAAMLGPRHPDLASTGWRIAGLAMRSGDPHAAMAAAQESLQICLVDGAGKGTPALALARLNLGTAYVAARRWREALAEYREADRLYTRFRGSGHETARVARSGAALALVRLGQLDEADRLFASLQAEPSASDAERALLRSRLGALRSAQGRHDEALALLLEATQSFAAIPRERLRALALGDLGAALVAAGDPRAAIAPLQEARALLQKSQPNGSPDLADVALELARARLALGDAGAALQEAAGAVSFWQGFDPQQREGGAALQVQAATLRAAGRHDEAVSVQRQAEDRLAAGAAALSNGSPVAPERQAAAGR